MTKTGRITLNPTVIVIRLPMLLNQLGEKSEYIPAKTGMRVLIDLIEGM